MPASPQGRLFDGRLTLARAPQHGIRPVQPVLELLTFQDPSGGAAIALAHAFLERTQVGVG